MTFLAEERGARGLDPNAELLFHRRLQEKNAASLSLGAWLATFFIPIFWALDWMVVPDHVWLTGALRALCTLACLAIVVAYRVHRKWVLRAVDWLAPALEVLIGVSIAAMTWLHEGYESPYYAGLNLTVICAGFLFSWPLRTAIVAHGSVYLLYMLPMLVGIITVDDAAIVLNNQFFLVGTIVIILASQRYRYILEGRQFQANYDLQKTKASLEDALERLKEADRLKTRFFGNITHELRTPLTLILAPLESLLSGDMGALSAAQTTYIEGIRKSALKLLKLISDLLDLARLGERYMTLNLVPTELASLLRELVEHARPLAARKNIELSVEIRSPQVNLEVDPEKLERVLVNLLSNALKFTPEGGRVGIWMEAEARVVRVGVHDTGIGIPEDKLKKIFERFVQADGSVTRRFGGTGIGLAFAQEIVDLHGGTIQVHSMEGEGSTFVVELPSVAPAGRREGPAARAPEVVARTRTPRTPAPEQVDWTRQILEREEYRFLQLHEVTERRIAERSDDAGKGTKILVVEDNVEVLRFIHHELQPEHRVYLAQDGAQGLELALREIPDVIISDYMMPVMDGPTMVRALRANPVTAEIPVVMLTARNTPEDRTEGREAGADVYIAKPFSPRELRGSIRELLKKRGRLATTVLKTHVRSLETISAGLAHEIHNPLSYIRNALVVIAEQVTKINTRLEGAHGDAEIAKAQKRIENMSAVAERGIGRIEQLVQLVRRYAREGYPQEPDVLALDAMVSDVLALVGPRRESAVTLERDLQAGGAAVRCIPEELHQVVRNLVQNAIDACGSEGTVRVETRARPREVLLRVLDDGPGIPADLQARIFTPFFSTKGRGDGMGLGLAITHQIIAAAKGRLELKSVEGEGTTFEVYLPRAAAEPAAASG